MQILLDECVPRRLLREFAGHRVRTVPEMGWSGTKNGALLQLADEQGFEVFLTVDRNVQFQQRLPHFRFGVILLTASSIGCSICCPSSLRYKAH